MTLLYTFWSLISWYTVEELMRINFKLYILPIKCLPI